MTTGGLLGLTLPSIFPNLFTHLLVMNTALGLGKSPGEGWIKFYNFIKRSPDADVGALISRGTKHLTEREIAAYNAPHPDYESKVIRILGIEWRCILLTPICKG